MWPVFSRNKKRCNADRYEMIRRDNISDGMEGECTLVEEPRYLRDRKKLSQRNIEKLDEVIEMLLRKEVLPQRYKNHRLSGDFRGCMECHIDFDCILVYRYEQDMLVLRAMRTGNHKNVLGV